MSQFVRFILQPLIDPIELAGRPSKTLCRLCQGITAEALISENGYTHVDRIEDLSKTWLKCSLCHILDNYYLQRGKLAERSKLRLKVGSMTPARMGDGAVLTVICEKGSEEEVWNIDCLFVLVPQDDPAANCGLPLANRHLSNTRSPETFQFIKSCIEECSLQHTCVTPIINPNTIPSSSSSSQIEQPRHIWPARLIHVNAFSANENPSKDAVCIVDVKGNCPKYITLSHCWGSSGLKDEQKTTTQNLNIRKARIPLHNLALNFRHAVEITRRLGINHLWIDALCILQDSEEDWASESVKMGAIYEKSVLTIAASQSPDSSGGCFNKRSKPHDHLPSIRKEMQSIEITNARQDGRKSTVLFHYELRSSDPLPLRSSPLNPRGWIYQERSLSPRTVHFTPTQVVWECRDMFRLEDLLPTPVPVYATTMSALVSKKRVENNDFIEHWYRNIVCTDYSRRSFTKCEDRLIALAGLARIWQQYVNDSYLAGLWQSHIAFGLAWMRNQQQEFVETEVKVRRPTWTWASHDGFVAWYCSHSRFTPEPHLAVVKPELNYRANEIDGFGFVIGGFITIRGLLTNVAIRLITGNTALSGKLDRHSSLTLFIDYPNLNDFSLAPELFPALVIGHSSGATDGSVSTYLLILKPEPAIPSSYLRIGFALVKFPTLQKNAEFWARLSPQELHLF